MHKTMESEIKTYALNMIVTKRFKQNDTTGNLGSFNVIRPERFAGHFLDKIYYQLETKSKSVTQQLIQ